MKRWLPALALVFIIAVPFLLRRAELPTNGGKNERTVVVVTPHNEAIRREFAAAFERWSLAKTGERVRIDWRALGGTSEITRYLRSTYLAAFENHWTRALGKTWSGDVASACMNDRLAAESSEARRAFLENDVSCGIDIFFGGGSFEFEIEARAGRLVDAGLLQRHPEWFLEEIFPLRLNGEPLRDPKGRWYGAALSSFGILYNRDAVTRLGATPPTSWTDLAAPEFFGQIALADPTKSGSMAKAFEMLIQQQIHARLAALENEVLDPKTREARAVREGWLAALRLIQRIGANARYFTDSAQQIPIDVSQGDCAAGMCIDFYGRYQEESVLRRADSPRLKYITPPGGSVYSADPIGLLRGAPNREAAVLFMEFVLSAEGQRLWNLRVGTDGGPEIFALRRLPVRKDFFADEKLRASRSDPEVNPYAELQPLVYRAEWTAGLFREIGFIVRVMCLDTHEEFRTAWREIVAADFPEEAVGIFHAINSVAYDAALGSLRDRRKNRLDEMALARELAAQFRAQYLKAAEVARLKHSPH